MAAQSLLLSDRPHAAQVCTVCKGRKKKCDKVTPSCGYCVRKGLECVYIPVPPRHDALALEGGRHSPLPPISLLTARARAPATDVVSHVAPWGTIPWQPATMETNLYLQVNRIIRTTGQFVDDITARYFQGMHRYLPVVSRTRFHDSLITLGSTPAPDFSVLLLSICLLTYSPTVAQSAGQGVQGATQPVDQRQSLHLAARSLFAQAQVQAQASLPPSLHLIQAGLLLALYEFAHGHPDDAFAAVASCARMAYAARMHPPSRRSRRPTQTAGPGAGTSPGLEEKEAANTWWGIVICERCFSCEITEPEQPLVTVILSGDVPVPAEPEVLDQSDILGPGPIPNIPVSCLTSREVGEYGRTAQATWLLDQVLRVLNTTDCELESSLIELDGLDNTLQSFLAMILQQCHGQLGVFCAAIACTIRTLFILHWHILERPPQIASVKFRSPEEWCKNSCAVLDTITKMVVDIADSHENMVPSPIDALTPSYGYILRAALKHVEAGVWRKGDLWPQDAGARLRSSLDRFNHRWGVGIEVIGRGPMGT